MSLFDKKSNYPSDNFRSINYKGLWQKKFIDEYIDSKFNIGVDQTNRIFSNSKQEHLPKYLYKFYSPSSYSISSIQNNSIYLSKSRDFNDPFDSYICVEDKSYFKYYILKSIKGNNLISKNPSPDTISEDEFNILEYAPIDGRYMQDLGYSSDFQSRLFHIYSEKSHNLYMKIVSIIANSKEDRNNKVKKIRNLHFGISCFSNFQDDEELAKNTTMWSHYADKHTGFCVKYILDFENIINPEIIKCGLLPVIYSSRVPKLTLTDFKKLKIINEDIQLSSSVLKKVYKALITKSKFWNYEKEWRLIISKDHEALTSNNTISFLNIDSIYLGCKMNLNLKKSLVKYAETENIKIYSAYQSDEHFELEFSGISINSMDVDEYFSKLYKYNRIQNDVVKQRNLFLLNRRFENLKFS